MKNKNIIYFVFILILLTLFYFVLSKNDSPESSKDVVAFSNSTLSYDNDIFDFGDVDIMGGKVDKLFRLKNTGKEPVIIKKVYTSCGCTTANILDANGKEYGTFGMQGHKGYELYTNIKVGPGETVDVNTIYDPLAHGPNGTGFARRMVYIETNSRDNPKITLSLQANVIKK